MALPLVCFCAFLGQVTVASAKPVIPKEGPPVLAPVDLKVEGRLPVRILLKAPGLQRSPVKFVIRQDPEFGRVRLLKQLTGDSVEVEYVPPADRSILADTFLFAGSNAQGFSSDAKARIQIVDIGPRLSVPLALDFAATRVGRSTRLPLEVRNSGDQPAEGQITVAAPWELEEAADRYLLAPGERKTVGVVFKPSKAGWAQGEVRLSGAASATVQMRAEALDWVEVANDPFGFVWADAGKQTAELALSNLGAESLELMLQSSPPLDHVAKVWIEPGKSISVPLSWRGDGVPGGWGTLLLHSPTGMRRVVVWSLDAILSGLGPALVLAGDEGSAGARRTFTNTGGRSGSWTFSCTPPFYLSDAEPVPKAVAAPAPAAGAAPPPLTQAKVLEAPAAIPGFVWDHNQNRYVPSASVAKAVPTAVAEPKEVSSAVPKAARATELTRRLQPGESFVLFVGLSGKPLGLAGTLFVKGPGQSHEEPLFLQGEDLSARVKKIAVASVPAPSKTPQALPLEMSGAGAALPPPSALAIPQPTASVGGGALPSLFVKKAAPAKMQTPDAPVIIQDAFLPGLFLRGFRVKDVTSDSATIVFPAGLGVTPEHLVVRYREMHLLEGGDPIVKWVPFRDADRKGKRVGENIEIRLRGLPAGWCNVIDLVGPPFSDGSRERLFQSEIITLPSAGALSPKSPWLWTVLLALLAGAYVLRRGSK